MRPTFRSLLAILSLVATVSQAAPPARWTIHNLGDLAGGAGGSIAHAINDRGQVVGEATAAVPGGFQLHAFLWEDGVMRDMGTPPGRTMSGAEELNDRGTALVGDGLGGSYLWRDGTWDRLTFGGFVNDLNRFEAMTGAYAVAGRTHAFVYRDGVVQDLGTLGGGYGAGYAISDRGVVVGNSTVAGESAIHPFLWRDGVMRDLGSFGGYFSIANDVNNHGVAVGTAVDAAGGAYAFYSDGGAIQRLLPGLPSPQNAKAINDRGAIVGDLGQNGSFLYDDGVITRLESVAAVQAAGWARLVPTGINNRGWITGWGYRASGGSIQAFVLTPR
jgi:probable HAF family extracellular repeat protein